MYSCFQTILRFCLTLGSQGSYTLSYRKIEGVGVVEFTVNVHIYVAVWWIIFKNHVPILHSVISCRYRLIEPYCYAHVSYFTLFLIRIRAPGTIVVLVWEYTSTQEKLVQTTSSIHRIQFFEGYSTLSAQVQYRKAIYLPITIKIFTFPLLYVFSVVNNDCNFETD